MTRSVLAGLFYVGLLACLFVVAVFMQLAASIPFLTSGGVSEVVYVPISAVVIWIGCSVVARTFASYFALDVRSFPVARSAVIGTAALWIPLLPNLAIHQLSEAVARALVTIAPLCSLWAVAHLLAAHVRSTASMIGGPMGLVSGSQRSWVAPAVGVPAIAIGGVVGVDMFILLVGGLLMAGLIPSRYLHGLRPLADEENSAEHL